MKKLNTAVIMQIACIISGNFILAFGTAAFAIPHSVALIGVNGVALNLYHYFGIDMSLSIVCINIGLFILGYWVMGKEFAASTILSSILYPLLFHVMIQVKWLPALTDDHFMATVLTGICIGIGLGLILRAGSSSGGIDILAIVFNKRWKWPAALTLNAINGLMLLVQMFFTDSNGILYGIVALLISGVVMNQILLLGEENIQVIVISREYDRINQIIQEKIHRGSTLIPVETGYLHQMQKAILCVLSVRELNQLKQDVHKIDEQAFVIITNAREVRGIGFTLNKYPA